MSVAPQSEQQAVITDQVIRDEVSRILREWRDPPPSRWKAVASNPLTPVVVGFVLTGILGAGLATWFQSAAEASKRDAEARASVREAKRRLVDSLGLFLNDGSYAADLFLTAVTRDPPGRSRDSTRRNFARFNAAFERRDIVDAARLCAYFGPRANAEYGGLATQIRFTGVYLRAFDDTMQRVEAGDISDEFVSDSAQYAADTAYEHMRDSIYVFTLGLVNHLDDADTTQPHWRVRWRAGWPTVEREHRISASVCAPPSHRLSAPTAPMRTAPAPPRRVR